MPLLVRAPGPPLSAFVSTLWLADHHVVGPHGIERILPTGNCSLIIDLASGGSLVSGPHSESFLLTTVEQFWVAGVEFTPGGALPCFDVPISELVNLHVPLDALCAKLAAELRERMLEAATPEDKLTVLERMLTGRIVPGRARNPAVAHAVGEFQRRPDVVRISDVVDRLGLSHRRFLEVFTTEVGLTPKLFCRIRRFQRVLQLVYGGRDVEWTDVALSCGYYDQAHFIKEFLAFSGVNPSTYRASAGPYPTHVPVKA